MASSTVTDPTVGSSTEFPGRVIAALATDPNIMARSGGTFITAEIAQCWRDGYRRQPPSLRAQRGAPIYAVPIN